MTLVGVPVKCSSDASMKPNQTPSPLVLVGFLVIKVVIKQEPAQHKLTTLNSLECFATRVFESLQNIKRHHRPVIASNFFALDTQGPSEKCSQWNHTRHNLAC